MKKIKKKLICFLFLMIGMFGIEIVYAADAICIYEGTQQIYTFKVTANNKGSVDFEFEHKKTDSTDRLTYNVAHDAVSSNFINNSTNKIVCPNQLYYKMTGGGTTTGVTLSFIKFDGAFANPIALSKDSTNNNKTLSSTLKSCTYSGKDAVSNNVVSNVSIILTNSGLSFEATNGYIAKNIDPDNINTSTFTKDTDCNAFTTFISCGSSGSDKYCSISKTNTIRPGTEAPGNNTPDAEDIENQNESQYTCSYKGQINGKNLIITKSHSHWIITLPDGSEKKYSHTSVGNNVFPSNSCEDVFYSEDSNSIKMVSSTSEFRDIYIAQYCRTSSDLEQYCANGTCKIDNPLCGSDGNNGSNGGSCPRELKPIILFLKKVAFNTLQIFVPILLIVMGSIDMVRAVMANDDKAIKDATSKFIHRALAAILCFFVVTIVTIVMDMFAKTDVGGQNDWKACWHDID